jgi:hypothetical protein
MWLRDWKVLLLGKTASLDGTVNSLLGTMTQRLRKILFRSVNREPLAKLFDRKTDDFLPGQLAFTARWIATSYCWRCVCVWVCCFQCSLFRVEKDPQASILTRDNSQKVGVFFIRILAERRNLSGPLLPVSTSVFRWA